MILFTKKADTTSISVFVLVFFVMFFTFLTYELNAMGRNERASMPQNHNVQRTEIKILGSSQSMAPSHQENNNTSFIVLDSLQDIEDFISLKMNEMGQMWDYTHAPQIASELREYNEDYFLNNQIIMVFRSEASGSNRISAEEPEIANETLNITINRHVPEIGNRMMAYWSILFPIQRDVMEYSEINIIVDTFELDYSQDGWD
ncbi:MAG: hypothetical protein FWG98_03185 [Candidatus Cloacimonetes bacterium]|nr:hypothetical protein [Candidatus Cloacimonadota bacterium]